MSSDNASIKLIKFVNSLFVWDAEIVLDVLTPSPVQKEKSDFQLAASAKQQRHGSLEFLGTLATSNLRDVLARVFFDHIKQNFQVFIVDNNPTRLKGGILSTPSCNKFTTINNRGIAVIPKKYKMNS